MPYCGSHCPVLGPDTIVVTLGIVGQMPLDLPFVPVSGEGVFHQRLLSGARARGAPLLSGYAPFGNVLLFAHFDSGRGGRRRQEGRGGRAGARRRGPRRLRRALPRRGVVVACKELAGRVVSASRARGLPRRSFASGLGGHAQAGRLPRGLHRGRAGEQVSRKASLLRRCALPAPKTFDGYNWSAVSWPGGFGRDELLFQVVSEAYESQSVVITTNLEFSRWGRSSARTRWRPP